MMSTFKVNARCGTTRRGVSGWWMMQQTVVMAIRIENKFIF